MRLGDLVYELPADLIAQDPAAQRSDARLLVLNGDDRTHTHVRELPHWLRAGDLLVLNDTRVIPARVRGRRPSGGRIEILLCEPHGGDVWDVLAKGSPRVGERIVFAIGEGEWIDDL